MQYLQQWFNDAAELHIAYTGTRLQISPWLMTPFSGALTPAQQAFNTAMSACRITVEWGFGRVVALWPYVDYAKKQQVALSACGLAKQYQVAGILTNCSTCFYGNSTSKFFNVTPPTLRQYLQGEGDIFVVLGRLVMLA
ncbi:unnamed protein product [Pylaiella littoralis]